MIGPANLVQGLPEVAVYLPESSKLKDKSLSSRNFDLAQLESFEFLQLAEPPYYDLQDYLHLLVVDYLQNLRNS